MRVLLFVAYTIANRVSGHPLCFLDDKPTDYDQVLTFCPTPQDGACCNDAEEELVQAHFDSFPSLTGDCADLYKEVSCGVCHSYSAHLFEQLGAEYGIFDGMTMKSDFCEDLVSACEGQLAFPPYLDGEDYCTKHVGGSTDRFWSYPYMEPEIFDPGLTDVFPDLDTDDDFPSQTISMRQSPDGSMYWLMGQLGEVKKVDADNLDSISTVVDISGGEFYEDYEEGLLDFAFGPMFGVAGSPSYFYLSYTCLLDDGENQRNRLSKFEYFAGDPEATRASEEVLITGAPKFNSIHAAGWCGFKPSAYGNNAAFHDLYWVTGDGGPQTDPLNTGQDTLNILGSMMRISVPSDGTGYTIPSGNLGDLPDVLPEICASGFRNPFRCSFDRETDELYCGDVGHTDVEEIDIVECGNNYGWSRFEGSRCQEAQEDRDGPCEGADRSGFTFPVFEYCHPDYSSTTEEEAAFTGGVDICGERFLTGHSVIGGYVYRGEYFADLLYGAYIFGDNTNQNIYFLKKEDGEFSVGTIISDGSVPIISFSEDINSELIMITEQYDIFHMPCGDLCETTCLDQAEEQPTIESLGCFGDLSSNRALDLDQSPTCGEGETAMSAAICASYCATIPGATLAGVEFSVECFCGDDNSDFDKHGSLSSESCDMLCSATPDEFCGGKNAIEIFEIGAPAPALTLAPAPATTGNGTPPPTVAGPTPVSPTPGSGPTPASPTPSPVPASVPSGTAPYLGCYADSKAGRIMVKMASQADMTAEVCSDLCDGSEYFGTQYSVECWCGDADTDFDIYGEAVCDFPCAGDPEETCGGNTVMSVYEGLSSGPAPAPVTPTTPTSTEYLGCYADSKAGRIMVKMASQNDMTAEVCSDLCDGSEYFGTQYSSECWCGDPDTDFDIYGDAVCDFPCAGDPDEICGGHTVMSVYQGVSSGPAPAPVTPTTPTSTEYIGCFADMKSARIMTVASSTNDMTAEVCAATCTGSTSFGTQYGVECWCGDGDYTQHGEGLCTYACSGDASEICGGFNAMSVYTY